MLALLLAHRDRIVRSRPLAALTVAAAPLPLGEARRNSRSLNMASPGSPEHDHALGTYPSSAAAC